MAGGPRSEFLHGIEDFTAVGRMRAPSWIRAPAAESVDAPDRMEVR
jgi:hypothetical protein